LREGKVLDWEKKLDDEDCEITADMGRKIKHDNGWD
jgi:hypothetical protein